MATASREPDHEEDSSSDEEIDTYHSSKSLKNVLHGNIYQLKVLMFYVYVGLTEGSVLNFKLATEMNAGEKFDDVVFSYQVANDKPWNRRCVQIKHKMKEEKKITLSDLLNENDKDFSVQKYFISYRKIKKNLLEKEHQLEKLFIFTNIDFDSENGHFIKVMENDAQDQELNDSLIYLWDAEIDGCWKIPGDRDAKCEAPAHYRIRISEQHELYEILENTCNALVLARKLVEKIGGVNGAPKLITLGTSCFQTYRHALATHVIDVGKKRFFDSFIDGESLSDEVMKFRKIFERVCLDGMTDREKKKTKSSIWDEIGKKELRISEAFAKLPAPKLTKTKLEEFAKEFAELVVKAGANKEIVLDGESRTQEDVRDINELVRHVLVHKNNVNSFKAQFLDDSYSQLRDIKNFKTLLKKELAKDNLDYLKEYRFIISNFDAWDEFCLKCRLPEDSIEPNEIKDFFDKLVFAVNQPKEDKLGEWIREEIRKNPNLCRVSDMAGLVSNAFLEKMLDWFKDKLKKKGAEGRFFSKKDGDEFFDSINETITALASQQADKLSLPGGS